MRVDAGDRKQIQGEYLINNGYETGEVQHLERGQSNNINADKGMQQSKQTDKGEAIK